MSSLDRRREVSRSGSRFALLASLCVTLSSCDDVDHGAEPPDASTGATGGEDAGNESDHEVSLTLDGGDLDGWAGCPRLTAEGGAAVDAGNVTAAQAWCTPGASNSAGCPAVSAPGSACSTPNLRCGYRYDAGGVVLDTCDGRWSEVAHRCGTTCAPPDASSVAVSGAVCGSVPDIPCGDRADTDDERATTVLGEVAACCRPPTESQMDVWLVDGCITALDVLREPATGAFSACMVAALRGRRIACARSLACLSVSWSTLP